MDYDNDSIFMHQYDLVLRQGLFYKKFSNVPFTGDIDGDENGQLESKRNYKKGIRDGKWVHYTGDGELWKTKIWKDGELIETIEH